MSPLLAEQSDSETVPADEGPDDGRSRGRSTRFIRLNFLVSGLLIGVVCLSHALRRIRAVAFVWHSGDGWLWIAALQTIALVVLLVRYRPRPTILGCIATLVPIGFVYFVCWLMYADRFDAAAFWALETAALAVLTAGWLVVGVGAMVFILEAVGVKRRVLTRRPSLWLRMWVMTTAFLGTAEVVTRLIPRPEPESPQPLMMPDGYARTEGDEFHIVAIGGSTMLGFPYHPKVSIPTILATFLEEQDPNLRCRVTNLAVNGGNLRIAANRLHKLKTRPDLLLLYTGHNEYFHSVPPAGRAAVPPKRISDPLLNWSASYRTLTEMLNRHYLTHYDDVETSIIRETNFTSGWISRRVQRFRGDLRALAEHARRQAIPMQWFLPATNEGVFSPNRSPSRGRLSAEEIQDLNQRFSEFRHRLDDGDHAAALSEVEQLNREYPDIAEIEFWLGICERERGDPAAAMQWFHRAAAHDGFPAHTTAEFHQAVSDVAKEYGIELIDATAVLRAISPTGLLDRHVIHDNVHPTLRGYYQLGQAAWERVMAADLLETGTSVVDSPPSFAETLERLDFGQSDLATAYDRIAYCLEILAGMRLHDRDRAAESAQYGKWAEQISNEVIAPGEDGTESFDESVPPGVRFPE